MNKQQRSGAAHRVAGNRLARSLAITAVAALALTGCGGGGNAADSADGKVSLRFAWWGSDSRAQATNKIIEAFEAKNPNIDIQGEYSDWSGYWDKLATQVASNDAPDIIQMDDKYLREYADRGALLDLDGVDVSKFEEVSISNGTTENGLVGITTGINSFTLTANPKVLKEAGLDVPDDKTWTWDDYREITETVSEKVEGKYGSEAPNEPAGLQTWLRQSDKHLTNESGELGLTVEDLAGYFQHHQDLLDNGSYPVASVLAENQNAGPDRSMTGTGTSAFGMWWSNQLGSLSAAAGVDLVPLRLPSASGNAQDNGLWYKSSMLMSGYSKSKHPEETKKFIDFMVNSEEAGELNKMDRGLPANTEIRELVVSDLQPIEAASADFVTGIEEELAGTEPIPPMGFSKIQDILYRYEMEIFFKRQTTQDAAQNAFNEMQSAVQ
ncbi:ABC transporter substrate-binding protein [Arthrobacter sp. MYb213]|uniref:ABC transporter substrate-binding protein n=1 Tax=Arthrobacter sp. MYb213 TaxID=1848595 RepID=UPI000CFC3430|nr:ABC transporter substrate-binding protein [Arthrobacter sp. MYb213]PRB70070.1 ABC transporter substrate-binding protein [Arthrobacter sp. MYb213]